MLGFRHDEATPSYFEQAIQDFQTLGLLVDGDLAGPPSHWGWRGLYDLVESTASIGSSNTPPSLEPLTDLGEKALELMETSVKFGNAALLAGCPATESKLLYNISSESVASDNVRSPLIITNNGEPAGLIKGFGERSCYGLSTDLETGLVEGCFSEPSPYIEHLGGIAERLPKTSRAWSLPIEEAGQFRPMRFSAFAVPVSKRVELLDNEDMEWYQRVLWTSHGAIMKQAKKLLRNAVPLEIQSYARAS